MSFVLGYWCSVWCISRQGRVRHCCDCLVLSSFVVWWFILLAGFVSVTVVVVVVLCTVGRPHRCRCCRRGGPCLGIITVVVVLIGMVKLECVRNVLMSLNRTCYRYFGYFGRHSDWSDHGGRGTT